MRVAFDLDDTLIPVGRRFATDPPTNLLLRWLTKERLRSGSRSLLRSLIADGHDVWIYTTSLRPAWLIRLTFRAYGIDLGGVVNQMDHTEWLRSPGAITAAPSKYPPAFGIDVLVDDSAGVVIEGGRYGFRVINVTPADENWPQTVRLALGLNKTE